MSYQEGKCAKSECNVVLTPKEQEVASWSEEESNNDCFDVFMYASDGEEFDHKYPYWNRLDIFKEVVCVVHISDVVEDCEDEVEDV